ncbi:MAG: helix-turn-helix domain-containing protein [Clostridia bacterium]|nr:helix-turn-helix domain-containing protein [Clostridia bacterium]
MKQTTGEFLETLRKASGFTQLEVAERLGVSNRTVSSWETDRTAPDLLILPAIADLYGVTVDEIIRGERKAGVSAEEISEKAKRDLRKRRYAQYGTRRALCLGFGVLGAVLFLVACAVLLYAGAPLWLSILLMVIGACGCAACVILLACFTYSAVRGEGIVLKEDYTEDNKAFVLSLRHATANSLKLLSLPYILGAIIYLFVYFAAKLYDYDISFADINITVDYATPTAVIVILCAAFGLSLIIWGVVYHVKSVKNLGNEAQKAVLNKNRKLVDRLCVFGVIPVAIALFLMCHFNEAAFDKKMQVYFTADSVDEVYRQFQTLKTDGITAEQEDGSIKTIVPAGEYFLNFQSETFVKMIVYDYGDGDVLLGELQDLGNGFYAKQEDISIGFFTDHVWYERFETNRYWDIYILNDGVTAEDLQKDKYYADYMTYTGISVLQNVYFDYCTGEAYNVAYGYTPVIYSGWNFEEEAPLGRLYNRHVNYYEDEKVWRYELIRWTDYSNLFSWTFAGVAAATVTVCTAIYFGMKKKTDYTF